MPVSVRRHVRRRTRAATKPIIVEGFIQEMPPVRDFRGDKTKFPAYVTVVLEDLAYGGPEEGGWWYHTFEKVESRRVLDGNAAASMVAQYSNNPDYDNFGRPPLSSVMSQGRYQIQITQRPFRSSPAHRPRYE
jgi:hypothetical protein